MNETAERLMDLAEAHMRNGGYGELQFSRSCSRARHQERERSSSFPTKATLAAAVADVTPNDFLLPLHGAQTQRRNRRLPVSVQSGARPRPANVPLPG